MFEIRLDAGQEDEEKVGGKQKEEAPCVLSAILSRLPQQEVDPLNFQEGEELKLRDWEEGRRGWSQRTPQTLLDALANMDVKSVYSTVVDAERGAAQRHLIPSVFNF